MKNYIVLDLEWNQSPDGREGAVEHIPFEIIEIGAVRLDESMRETGQFRRAVKPVIYPEMHFKISEVTHMDMEELNREGVDFPSAVREFLEWCGEDCVFCTWGAMDLTELQRNMDYYGIPFPFAKPLLYYDVQKLYSLANRDGKERHSLDITVEELGMLEERPFHRALDDAYYTSKVMASLDFDKIKDYWSVDYYHIPADKEEELYFGFPGYSKYVSRAFDTKEDAIADKTVTDMVCYQCRRMLRKKVRWFSVNQKYYFALAVCPEHGYMKGKIRMKKADDGRIYVVKTLKLVDEAGAEQIYEKKEEAKKRRIQRTKSRKLNKKSRELENN